MLTLVWCREGGTIAHNVMLFHPLDVIVCCVHGVCVCCLCKGVGVCVGVCLCSNAKERNILTQREKACTIPIYQHERRDFSGGPRGHDIRFFSSSPHTGIILIWTRGPAKWSSAWFLSRSGFVSRLPEYAWGNAAMARSGSSGTCLPALPAILCLIFSSLSVARSVLFFLIRLRPKTSLLCDVRATSRLIKKHSF